MPIDGRGLWYGNSGQRTVARVGLRPCQPATPGMPFRGQGLRQLVCPLFAYTSQEFEWNFAVVLRVVISRKLLILALKCLSGFRVFRLHISGLRGAFRDGMLIW